MKTIHYLAIFAALTTSAFASPKTVLVHVQLVELATNGAKLPEDLSGLAERKGADVLASSELRTRSGLPTKLSATRNLTVPRKGTFETGVVLTVCPTFAGDHRIRYSVDFDRTEFEGFAARSSSQAPMFSTRKTIGIDGTTDIGKPVVLDLYTWQDTQTIKEPGKPNRTSIVHRRLFAILNFSKDAE